MKLGLRLRFKLREGFEDWIHWIKTGESTIHCEAGHKVFLDRYGGSRIIPSECYRTEKGRKILDDMCQLAKDLKLNKLDKDMKDTFEAQYQVEDGYAGSARPKYFNIRPEDLDEDMTDEDLEEFYLQSVEDHFKDHIYPCAEKVEQFVEWARKKLKEQASSEVG